MSAKTIALLFRSVLMGSLLLLPLSTVSASEKPEKSASEQTPAPKKGTVRVRFLSPDGPVQLEVAGQRFAIKAGGAASVDITGAALRYVVSSGDKWRYEATLDLQRVSHRTINLKIPGMHVRVINRSDEPRQLLAGGRHFGLLKRNEARTVGPIPTGVGFIKTIGARSRTHLASTFENVPGGFATVVVKSQAPGLRVANPIQRRVQVRVDNRDYGLLPGREEIVILGLAPGQHDVELIDTQTGRPYRFDAQVRLDEATTKQSAALPLKVINETGEELEVPRALGGFFSRRVKEGETVEVTLPRKRFKLMLFGKRSGLVYDRDVDPRAERMPDWTIRRPRGQLHLRNGTGEQVSVTIDTFSTLTLPVAAKVTVRNVPAGRLQLIVRTEESKREFIRGVDLKPAGDVQWTVSTGRSSLLIRSSWAEPVDLAIDGSPRGRIGPEADFRVQRIEPGPHTVVAQTLVSKVREVVTLQIVDGEQTMLRLTPPEASLRLDNAGSDTLTVAVRGVEVGRVPAGKSGTFSTRSGRMAVEVRSTEPGRALTWIGTLAPAQHIILPNPERGSAPVLVDNGTKRPLLARLDARAPVTVPAGKRHRFEDLAQGQHIVEIRATDRKGPILRQRVSVAPGVPPVVIAIGENAGK